VGFEPTISAFECAKTVEALDRAATVIDMYDKQTVKWTDETNMKQQEEQVLVVKNYELLTGS
jgi:hypothetical protein